MQPRSSDENSVCPSVRPSVKRVLCDRTKERSVQIFIPYERSFSLFSEKKNGCWGRPLLPEILGQPAPIRAKSPIFNRYSLVAPRTHLAKKVQFTLIGSPLRAFQWAWDYVSPKPPKAQKRKTDDFRLKSHFAWRKSATKFLCVKTVSGKVVRHSLA